MLLLAACGGSPEATRQPERFSSEVALPLPADLSSDPHVLELNLEARVSDVSLLPGTTTPAWTYNGDIPGPLLRAKVGDRLVVHFKNSLPEETTIHWHGLRIPAAMDGAPGHGQPAVPPGGTFEYSFTLPDAGTFWYHPHFNSAAQVAAGLYGPLIVDDPAEPEGLGDELVLVLSDIALEADGRLAPADSGGGLGTLFGREGNVILVNGRQFPTIHARSGLRQRWRIINTSQARYFQLVLPGHEFTRIGGDGGFAAEPEVVSKLVIVPAGRADVLVTPRGSGDEPLVLSWEPYDRGFGTAYAREPEPVLQLRFDGEPTVAAQPLPELRRDIPAPDVSGATPVELDLTRNDEDGKLALGINGVPSWRAEHLSARVGEKQLWTVRNTMEWDHPFHLHGFFFQELDVNGVAPTVREWRDTVNVPVDGVLRLLVDFDERPGMWMFHCHILDHADAGMMGMLLLH